jgi:hypothetical protein
MRKKSVRRQQDPEDKRAEKSQNLDLERVISISKPVSERVNSLWEINLRTGTRN